MCLYMALCERRGNVPPPASGNFLCRSPTVIRWKMEWGSKNLSCELTPCDLVVSFFFFKFVSRFITQETCWSGATIKTPLLDFSFFFFKSSSSTLLQFCSILFLVIFLLYTELWLVKLRWIWDATLFFPKQLAKCRRQWGSNCEL